MKKKTKKINVVICLAIFAAFAIASGSSDSDKKSSTKTVTVEAEGNKNENSVSGDENKPDTNKSDSEKSNSADEEKLDYEVTDTRFEYYENSIKDLEYYGIVEVKNTGNCDIYLDNCTFDLEDNDGHLLQSDDYISSCPKVLSPGETGYFYNNIGSSRIDSSVSLDNGVKLVPQMKVSKAKNKPHLYPVSDVSVAKDDLWGLKVTGRVENDTDEEIKSLSLDILFISKDGKVLGITNAVVGDIAPGNKGSFDTKTVFGNENIKIEDIGETKVIAEETYYQF